MKQSFIIVVLSIAVSLPRQYEKIFYKQKNISSMRFEAYVLIEVHTGSIMKEIKTDDIFCFMLILF